MDEVLKKNTLYQLEVLFTESVNKKRREDRKLSVLLRASPNIESDKWEDFYKGL